MTLVLWGVQFAITLMYNVVLDETISGDTKSDGLAALGYSYWYIYSLQSELNFLENSFNNFYCLTKLKFC